MKKMLFTFIILSLLVVGCSKNNKQLEIRPYEVFIKNNILSYYDIKENIPSSFNILSHSINAVMDIYHNNHNNIIIDSNENIRCIFIIDEDIVTFNQISVGDKFTKIEEKFSYEYKLSDYCYTICFNDNMEEVKPSSNNNENWICITYFIEDDTIMSIMISDNKYLFKLL